MRAVRTGVGDDFEEIPVVVNVDGIIKHVVGTKGGVLVGVLEGGEKLGVLEFLVGAAETRSPQPVGRLEQDAVVNGTQVLVLLLQRGENVDLSLSTGGEKKKKVGEGKLRVQVERKI